MAIRTVGLLSPGDMGHAVGAVLCQNGLGVLTYLTGRSQRTHALAAQAGIQDVPTLTELVRTVDVLLCILVPSEAIGVAQQVADAIRESGFDPTRGHSGSERHLLYADCNAIAPETARTACRAITAAGGRFADVGIIGSPPTGSSSPRFYASGPEAADLLELADYGLDVRLLDGEVGQASGLKMCYGALTKGLQALGTELLVAARAMGLEAALKAEQRGSLAEVRAYLENSVPSMAPKAYRWVGEMEEIAACFAHVGLTPRILQGAADVYRFVAETPIGKETPETRDPNRDLEGVIGELARSLEVGSRS